MSDISGNVFGSINCDVEDPEVVVCEDGVSIWCTVGYVITARAEYV